MSKHIIIWNQNSKDEDTIEVYSKDPSYAVLSNRKDLFMLKNVDESNLPGVYILSDAYNRRYVGQASSSVIQRLLQHEKTKSWWENLLFFGRDDGQLDKSQLDFLERKLIKLYSDAGFDLDNGDSGNNSFIAPYQRGKAESLWENTSQILEETAKVFLFKKSRVKKPSVSNLTLSNSNSLPNMDDVQTTSYLYSLNDSLGNNIEFSKFRRLYIEWIKILADNDVYRQKFYDLRDNGSSVFRDSEFYDKRGLRWTEEISDQLYLMVNLSTKDIRKRMEKVSEILDVKINFS